MKPALFVCLVLSIFVVPSEPQNKSTPDKVYIPLYLVSAGDFLEMAEADRVTYMIGFMDGLYGSGFFGASDAALVRLKSCTSGMNTKQFAAIVTKYVKDHPGNWHYPLPIEAVEALNASCHGGLGLRSGN